MIRSILLTLIGISISVFTARAATFTIANNDVDALKQAIITSKTNAQPDTIILALRGTYTFTTSETTSDTQGSALPELWEDGNAANTLTIFGNGSVIERDLSAPEFRIIKLATGTLILYDLHIRNGKTTLENGAGIRNSNGTLKLYNCTLSNHTEAFMGGAIWNGPSTYVLLTNCTITTCTAATGYAIYNANGKLDLINCTVAGNTGRNSNSAALASSATTYSTYNAFVLYNTIVANNLDKDGAEADLSGAVTSGGHNLIGAVYDVNAQGYFPAGNPNLNSDYVGTSANVKDPLLNPLSNYGGLTPAMSLQSASSPCYNKGFNSIAPSYDQAGNNRKVTGSVEIGSMEYINDYTYMIPHLSVLQNTTVIPHQTGTYTFLNTDEGSSSAPVTFTIKNSNYAISNLKLLSRPALFVSGDVADFTIVKDTLRTEMEGMFKPKTGFQIIFTPASAGNKSITIYIASNDIDIPVYEFTVNGIADVVTTVLNDENNKLIISPNPSNGNFVVTNSEVQEGSLLRITDLSGRMLYEKEYGNGMPVNLNVAPGLYLLSVQKGEQLVVKKIIVE